MKLNYNGSTNLPEQVEVPKQEAPVQTSPYFSKRKSDEYRNFISMQQTVNAQLQKEAENDKVLNNDPNNVQGLPTGGAWNGAK